jgi:hypothetical protein
MKRELDKEAESLKGIIKDVIGVDIMKRTRMRMYVDAKMVYAKILRDRGYALSSIGRTLMTDHSMIIHYLRNVDVFIKTEKEMANMYVVCSTKFYDMFPQEDESNIFILQKKVADLTTRLNELTLERSSILDKEQSYARIGKIIDIINERTLPGKELAVERKINAMFNNGKI